MTKKIVALCFIMCFASLNASMAGSNYKFESAQPQPAANGTYQQSPQYPQNNTLSGSVIMVPAGTAVNARLTAELSSETAFAGEQVSMVLSNDFVYGGKTIAPAGSIVTGSVIEVSKAKHGSMNGKLCVRFTQINTPFGTQIPITAVIKTEDMSGVLVGGTKLDVTKEYAKDLAVGSAAGALSGVVFGALAGGNVGRGAALGTAVGAGGGLVKSAWDKGKDVVIPANAGIDLVFTQPVTVSGTSYFYEN